MANFPPCRQDEEHLPESRAESDDERRRKTKKEKASLQLVSLVRTALLIWIRAIQYYPRTNIIRIQFEYVI